MIPKYTTREFNDAKSNDMLFCECYHCKSNFLVMKKYILHNQKHRKNWILFCNKTCRASFLNIKETHSCKNCNKSIVIEHKEIKKSKSGNHFCSKSCSATYNNKHKTTGNRRSKLEVYLQEQLTTLYPDLDVHYNRKDTINSELDIYIPSMKLAFELNGIFHYEPIYGQEKLDQIQNNDHRKFSACAEKQISLCIIDTSSLKYFKEQKSHEYLSFIKDKINGL